MHILVLNTELLKYINEIFFKKCNTFLSDNVSILGKNQFMLNSYPIKYGNTSYNTNAYGLRNIKFFCVYGINNYKKYSKTDGCFSLVFNETIRYMNENTFFHYKLYFPISNDTAQELLFHALMELFVVDENIKDLLISLQNTVYKSFFESINCVCNYEAKSIDITLVSKKI